MRMFGSGPTLVMLAALFAVAPSSSAQWKMSSRPHAATNELGCAIEATDGTLAVELRKMPDGALNTIVDVGSPLDQPKLPMIFRTLRPRELQSTRLEGAAAAAVAMDLLVADSAFLHWYDERLGRDVDRSYDLRIFPYHYGRCLRMLGRPVPDSLAAIITRNTEWIRELLASEFGGAELVLGQDVIGYRITRFGGKQEILDLEYVLTGGWMHAYDSLINYLAQWVAHRHDLDEEARRHAQAAEDDP